jgi:hypothetical protein
MNKNPYNCTRGRRSQDGTIAVPNQERLNVMSSATNLADDINAKSHSLSSLNTKPQTPPSQPFNNMESSITRCNGINDSVTFNSQLRSTLPTKFFTCNAGPLQLLFVMPYVPVKSSDATKHYNSPAPSHIVTYNQYLNKKNSRANTQVNNTHVPVLDKNCPVPEPLVQSTFEPTLDEWRAARARPYVKYSPRIVMKGFGPHGPISFNVNLELFDWKRRDMKHYMNFQDLTKSIFNCFNMRGVKTSFGNITKSADSRIFAYHLLRLLNHGVLPGSNVPKVDDYQTIHRKQLSSIMGDSSGTFLCSFSKLLAQTTNLMYHFNGAYYDTNGKFLLNTYSLLVPEFAFKSRKEISSLDRKFFMNTNDMEKIRRNHLPVLQGGDSDDESDILLSEIPLDDGKGKDKDGDGDILATAFLQFNVNNHYGNFSRTELSRIFSSYPAYKLTPHDLQLLLADDKLGRYVTNIFLSSSTLQLDFLERTASGTQVARVQPEYNFYPPTISTLEHVALFARTCNYVPYATIKDFFLTRFTNFKKWLRVNAIKTFIPSATASSIYSFWTSLCDQIAAIVQRIKEFFTEALDLVVHVFTTVLVMIRELVDKIKTSDSFTAFCALFNFTETPTSISAISPSGTVVVIPKDDMISAESDASTSLGDLQIGIGAISSIVVAITSTLVEAPSTIKDVVNYLKSFRSLKEGTKEFLATLQECVDIVYSAFTGNPFFAESKELTELRQTLAECDALILRERTRAVGDAPSASDTKNAATLYIKVVEHKKILINASRLSPGDKTALHISITRVESILTSFKTLDTFRTTRPLPARVIFSGTAGTGKSVSISEVVRLSHQFLKTYVDHHNLTAAKGKELPFHFNTPELCAIKTFQTEEFPGDSYWFQFALFLDELGCSSDNEAAASSMGLWHSLADATPYSFNCSHVDRKAQCPMLSPLLLATTNTAFKDLRNTTNDLLAIQRRFDLVLTTRHPDDESFDLEKVVYSLDIDFTKLVRLKPNKFDPLIVDLVDHCFSIHNYTLTLADIACITAKLMFKRIYSTSSKPTLTNPVHGTRFPSKFTDLPSLQCGLCDIVRIDETIDAATLYPDLYSKIKACFVRDSACPMMMDKFCALLSIRLGAHAADFSDVQLENHMILINKLKFLAVYRDREPYFQLLVEDLKTMVTKNEVMEFGFRFTKIYPYFLSAIRPSTAIQDVGAGYATLISDGIMRVNRVVCSSWWTILLSAVGIYAFHSLWASYNAYSDNYPVFESLDSRSKNAKSAKPQKINGLKLDKIRISNSTTSSSLPTTQGGDFSLVTKASAKGAFLLFMGNIHIGYMHHISNGYYVCPSHVWRMFYADIDNATFLQVKDGKAIAHQGFANAVWNVDYRNEIAILHNDQIPKTSAIKNHLLPDHLWTDKMTFTNAMRLQFDTNHNEITWDANIQGLTFYNSQGSFRNPLTNTVEKHPNYMTARAREAAAFCGRLIIGSHQGTFYVLGIHVAGNNGAAYFLPLPPSTFDRTLPSFQSGMVPHSYVGRGELSRHGDVEEYETDINYSPFVPQDLVPSPLNKHFDHDGKGFTVTGGALAFSECPVAPADSSVEALENAVNKMTTNAKTAHVSNEAARFVQEQDPMEFMHDFYPKSDADPKLHMATLNQALLGDADMGMDPVDFTSSHKGSCSFDVPKFYKPDLRNEESLSYQYVAKTFAWRMALMLQLIFLMPLNIMALKHELRDHERVAQKKTRLFNITCLIDNLLLKAILGPLICYLKSRFFNVPNQCGIDPGGSSWAHMYSRLKTRGLTLEDLVAGDISGWDTCIPDLFAHIIAAWCCSFYMTDSIYGPTQSLIYWAIFSCFHALRFIGKRVFLLAKGNTSGNYVTTFLNSIVNYCFFKTIYILECRKRNIVPNWTEDMIFFCYSDDNISRCPNHEWWTFSVVQAAFKEHFGIVFTAPDKSLNSKERYSIEDVDFLSRKFGTFDLGHAQYMHCNVVSAPIKIESLVGQLHYIRADKNQRNDPEFIRKQLDTNIENVRYELMHYPAEDAAIFIRDFNRYCLDHHLNHCMHPITTNERVQYVLNKAIL